MLAGLIGATVKPLTKKQKLGAMCGWRPMVVNRSTVYADLVVKSPDQKFRDRTGRVYDGPLYWSSADAIKAVL